MGIFGELDAQEIPTNPFWVESGEYTAVVDSAEFRRNKDDTQDQLVIIYKITNAESEYRGKTLREQFNVYPDLKKEDYETMDGDSKKKIKEDLGKLKKRLCGQPEFNRTGLGVDSTELNAKWDPKSIVNLEVEIGIQNGGSENEYTNIRWIQLRKS